MLNYEVIPEGRRNDTLTRRGGYLRRKGAERHVIEAELLKANQRCCQPPLLDAEVQSIAASVSRYPVGGPNPLQLAWKSLHPIEGEQGYEKFIRLARALQKVREGQDVALPLKNIAELFGIAYTTVAYWRKKAVARGVLNPTAQYIPHHKAGCYQVIPEGTEAPQEKNFVTKPKTVTIGLVTNPTFVPIVTKCGKNQNDESRESIRTESSRQNTATSFEFGFNDTRFLAYELGRV